MPLKVDNMTTHGPSLTRVHDNDKVIDTDTDLALSWLIKKSRCHQSS